MEIELLIVDHGTRDNPNIALTFDDGPNPYFTPKVLDILRSNGCQATFFMIGRWAQEYHEIVKRIAFEGHAIGGHSFNHGGDDCLKPSSDLRLGNKVIEDIIGCSLR